MNMFSKHKKILLTLIGLVILFLAYWYFVLLKKPTQTQNMNTGGLTANVGQEEPVSSTTSSSAKVDKEFVSGILALNSVNIDTSVFATEAYKKLTFPDNPFPVDYALQVGRVNPFLPIGAVGRSPFNIIPQAQGGAIAPTNASSTPPVVAPASTTPATATTSSSTTPRAGTIRPTQVNR